uniref:Uncharacterized protein n=1 Tax=Caenorhabditis japonica TaxID=281687 RepID=A0A8R1EKP5_CAEJA
MRPVFVPITVRNLSNRRSGSSSSRESACLQSIIICSVRHHFRFPPLHTDTSTPVICVQCHPSTVNEDFIHFHNRISILYRRKGVT